MPIIDPGINREHPPAHLTAIFGAVVGTLVVIVIATVGVILVLILVMIAKRRKLQHQDTNKKGMS